jgi:hypothetical protein
MTAAASSRRAPEGRSAGDSDLMSRERQPAGQAPARQPPGGAPA